MVSIEARVLNSELINPSDARASQNGSKACTGVDAALLPSLALAQGSLNASQACRNVPYSPASAEPNIHLFCRTAAHAGLPPAPHARARAGNLRGSHLVSEKGNPPIATVEFSKFVFPRAMAFF